MPGTPAAKHGGDRCHQHADPDRLGDIIVHARGQAALAVVGQGVGGHGHDGDMPAPALLLLANPPRGLKAVHLRHLHVHENDVEAVLRKPRENFLAVGRHLDGVAPPGENLVDQLLIDQAVFADKDPQRRQIRFAAILPGGESRTSSPGLPPSAARMALNNSDCFTGFIRQAETPARSACATSRTVRGNQGQDRRFAQGRMAADRVGQVETRLPSGNWASMITRANGSLPRCGRG